MADYTGFLEKRKQEKGMERSTEMSQLDGMVSNLRNEVDQVIRSARKTGQRNNGQGAEDLKAAAD